MHQKNIKNLPMVQHHDMLLSEIDPGYVDVAIERMQRIFDLPVIHAKTGKTYADIQKERLGNSNHG